MGNSLIVGSKVYLTATPFGEVSQRDTLCSGIVQPLGITSTGCKLVLRDVRHVPKVPLNLISTGRLDDEGYTSSIRNGVIKFCEGSLIMAEARKTNTLYIMHARLCHREANVAHMSQKGMQKLANDNLVPEVQNVQLEVDRLFGR